MPPAPPAPPAALRRLTAAVLVAVVALAAPGRAGVEAIDEGDLREWLSYIASDDLDGRGLFSPGLDRAAEYIERHLRAFGARPAGDGDSYFQTVPIHDVRVTRRSSVTVQVGAERRTFADGGGVTFPALVGGRRELTLTRVEFAGYGVDAPRERHLDFAGKDLTGAAVIWLGDRGPRALNGSASRGLLGSRARYATEELRAAAAIGPAAQPAGAGRAGDSEAARVDFIASQRLDAPVTPIVGASDEFFEFLFRRAPIPYQELRARAAAQEPLPSFPLDGVTLTFTLDADYHILRTRTTRNVVAIVEGSDPAARDTYVAFGAHHDHVGGAPSAEGGTARRGELPGLVRPGAEGDRIWNGADDDGSGTVAMMALVKAFAAGPRPKRSLLFVWHSGEETGRYGSLFYADHPTVPLDRVAAQLNLDMIGRNRDDKPSEANTVYLVGADRISTELDAISRAANAALDPPLTISYELNEPDDSEQLYYRSDHYSYAAKGIPVIFFTTGLHPDYHRNTDEVSKIEFGKMTRVARLVYETGLRVANLDHLPVRDHKGARAR